MALGPRANASKWLEGGFPHDAPPPDLLVIPVDPVPYCLRKCYPCLRTCVTDLSGLYTKLERGRKGVSASLLSNSVGEGI